MFINRIRIRVEFGDCDPAQIVFFANYFCWFDQCTTALFRAGGLPLQRLFIAHGVIGIPLAEARARYIIPSAYGDELIAESCVTEWKKSSFIISPKFLRDGGVGRGGLGDARLGRSPPYTSEPNEECASTCGVIRRLSVAKKSPRRQA
jgi:4-hydroxybenzoyl-CoA thioesterase